MFLERLAAYADRLDLEPPMYQKTPIRWLLDLDARGDLRQWIPIEAGERGGDRGPTFSAPHVARSRGIRAKLLADNGEYVLGIARESSDAQRVRKCHEAFVEQVRLCAQATAEPSVTAVLRFLEHLDRANLSIPNEFDASQICTFRVEGTLPIELPSVQTYWGWVAKARREESSSEVLPCLVCGRDRPAVQRLPFKIKGVPGGKSTGTAIISANAPAFESYGLEASHTAPTCAECGERFSKAANGLLESEKTHLRIGPLVYLVWTGTPSKLSVAPLLSSPQTIQVRALMASTCGGPKKPHTADADLLHMLGFSANGSRAVVRDWLATTVSAARQHLARYFALQQVVEPDGGQGPYYGIYALAAATVRSGRELAAGTASDLMHAALTGGPLPRGILQQVVHCARSQRCVTRLQAALIKMALLSEDPTLARTGAMVRLDPGSAEPGYLCGRLLAVLRRAQLVAFPGSGPSIALRFYGTLSLAPAAYAGMLLRSAEPYLMRLRRERPQVEKEISTEWSELRSRLGDFPERLSLTEQGWFGLGYYHQRAADRAERLARMQKQSDPESLKAAA